MRFISDSMNKIYPQIVGNVNLNLLGYEKPRKMVLSKCMDTEEMKKIIGRNLRNARESLGLSQGKLALKCGWDKERGARRISNYEVGIRAPGPRELRVLANALNKSIDELTSETYNGLTPQFESKKLPLPPIKQLPLLESGTDIAAWVNEGILPENHRGVDMFICDPDLSDRAYIMDISDDIATPYIIDIKIKLGKPKKIAVLVDPKCDPVPNQAVVCLIDGKRKIRQFVKSGEEFMLKSYEPPFAETKFECTEFLGSIVDISTLPLETKS